MNPYILLFLTRNTDWMKSLGISEGESLAEACGCGSKPVHDDEQPEMAGDIWGNESDMLSKSDALGAVMAIADMTSCPQTREILRRAVEEISSADREMMAQPLELFIQPDY